MTQNLNNNNVTDSSGESSASIAATFEQGAEGQLDATEVDALLDLEPAEPATKEVSPSSPQAEPPAGGIPPEPPKPPAGEAPANGQVELPSADESVDEDIILEMMLGKTQQQNVAPPTPPADDILSQETFRPLTNENPLVIPQNIVEQIFNEDSTIAAQGLNILMGSVINETANAAFQQAKRYVEAALTRNTAATQQQQVQNSYIQEIHTDFYTTHPNLAPYKKVVQHVTDVLVNKKMATDPNATWSPQLRDEIARTSLALIARLKPQAVAAPKPATYVAGNARPPLPPVTQQQPNDGFSDIIDSGF